MPSSGVTTDTTQPDAPGPLHLVVVTPEATVTRRCPDAGTWTIGRASASEVHIDHAALSRRHAQLRFDGDAVSIEDLGSANGTRLSGVRLAANVATRFERGQVVEIGPISLILHRAVYVPRVAVATAESPATSAVYRTIERIAPTGLSILILGETGVGKDVLAAHAHARSPRSKHAMVRINCAAMSETLLESELFGYEKGAFSGAAQAKPGLIETADGGTFFLDEIGELSSALQAKLLRVVEDRQVLRVGSIKPRTIDVRFIAATNRDLAAAVAEGRFRADLLHRLNTITVVLPPLRDRVGEIAALAQRFAERAATEFGAERPAISPEALAVLERHPWPGNVCFLMVACSDADEPGELVIHADDTGLAGEYRTRDAVVTFETRGEAAAFFDEHGVRLASTYVGKTPPADWGEPAGEHRDADRSALALIPDAAHALEGVSGADALITLGGTPRGDDPAPPAGGSYGRCDRYAQYTAYSLYNYPCAAALGYLQSRYAECSVWVQASWRHTNYETGIVSYGCAAAAID